MKAVLTSIQPYYVFLIIARIMGWNIPQKKTVEVRRDFPKATDWDKRTIIYCTKSKRSFKLIPKEYQPLMAPLLGKVIGEFVCDCIDNLCPDYEPVRQQFFYNNDWENNDWNSKNHCLTSEELLAYGKGKMLYGWHISDLKIYDQPRELSDYYKSSGSCEDCKYLQVDYWGDGFCNMNKQFLDYYDGYISCERCCKITCAPQSWLYVEV